jgi:anti-anti-sigma factor
MTQAKFHVTKASDGRAPAVAVAGDIDLANVTDFEEAMTAALDGSSELTVDLTRVSYCDSVAVRALFSKAATTKLTMIVRPSGHITTLLGISGLDRVATVIRKD